MSNNVYDRLVGDSSYKKLELPKESKIVENQININNLNPNSFGFTRIGSHTFNISLLNVKKNVESIKHEMDKAIENHEKIIVFPEMCLTGYTCGDMFFQNLVYEEVVKGLLEIRDYSKNKPIVFIIGLPLLIDGKNYNVAAVINNGHIKGIVPKTYLPNYHEFYEQRQFVSGMNLNCEINLAGEKIPCSRNLLFVSSQNEDIKIGVEICEDLWSYDTPSTKLAKSGATIICNLSASNELVGKNEYRKDLIKSTSARLNVCYAYSSSGRGESTTDLVYGGTCIIGFNGSIVKENEMFSMESVFTDIDVELLVKRRQENTSYIKENECRKIYCDIEEENIYESLINRFPFHADKKQCKEILRYQAEALKARLEHVNADPVIGLSGGLDSTLALIVSYEAIKLMNKSSRCIHVISMPAFGTSKVTRSNAELLANIMDVDFKEIDIKEIVQLHLEQIGHEKDKEDVTYENAQARERTQILMDTANMINGLVVGTGDLSEACLGWSTYNGDQMSNYAVNISLPKTLIKEVVHYYAEEHEDLKEVLLSILGTPISPELIPTSKGKIVQKTEDILGPYEVHDFFIYHCLRNGFLPRKIYYLATKAFDKIYSKEDILKWEKTFYKRFINMQFKRSCLPDGVKITSVSISPRGDLRMPSDAQCEMFIKDLENIK
ncbi:MAG TPA: NAD(+) synthase [Firmicutes bacterium]|nr:NAD(+) synthase [Bacillota bacterium]